MSTVCISLTHIGIAAGAVLFVGGFLFWYSGWYTWMSYRKRIEQYVKQTLLSNGCAIDNGQVSNSKGAEYPFYEAVDMYIDSVTGRDEPAAAAAQQQQQQQQQKQSSTGIQRNAAGEIIPVDTCERK